MKSAPLALFLLLASLLPAAGRRPMDFDDVMKLKSVGAPQISPDGKWVVYTVSAADMKENSVTGDLWLVGAGGGPGGTPAPRYSSGVMAKYARLVSTASRGAVTG